MYGEVNREEYAIRDTCKRVETLNIENQTITEPSTTKTILIQENRKK